MTKMDYRRKLHEVRQRFKDLIARKRSCHVRKIRPLSGVHRRQNQVIRHRVDRYKPDQDKVSRHTLKLNKKTKKYGDSFSTKAEDTGTIYPKGYLQKNQFPL